MWMKVFCGISFKRNGCFCSDHSSIFKNLTLETLILEYVSRLQEFVVSFHWLRVFLSKEFHAEQPAESPATSFFWSSHPPLHRQLTYRRIVRPNHPPENQDFLALNCREEKSYG